MLPSMGSHGVGHDWGDLAAAAAVSIAVRYKGVITSAALQSEELTPFSVFWWCGSFQNKHLFVAVFRFISKALLKEKKKQTEQTLC